jgi:hypothetical protein
LLGFLDCIPRFDFDEEVGSGMKLGEEEKGWTPHGVSNPFLFAASTQVPTRFPIAA